MRNLACNWHLEPVRTNAPRMQRTQRLSELALTQAEITNGIPEVIDQWRETFGS
jgi:hypothetical protein